MGTTPTYGFPYPELSDPPNGPSAFQALAEAVEDTITDSGLDAIAETLLNAKGDLVVASAADTAARLGVGSNNQILMADSGQATGVKWSSSVPGGMSASDTATVATSQTTVSTSYTDLTTPGPAVTVVVGASGIAIVTVTARIVSGSGNESFASVALSSGNVVAAADAYAASFGNTSGEMSQHSTTTVFTGLTPGSTVFTMKYKSSSGAVNATFSNRRIGVVTFG